MTSGSPPAHQTHTTCPATVLCSPGFRVQGLGFRLQGIWIRDEGLGYRVYGLGIRVQAAALCLLKGVVRRQPRGR
jgi:hypothetical protein